MPHTTIILRRDSMDAVIDPVASSQEEFLRQLAYIVADCFNDLTGEELVSGTTSRAYPPILTSSCPADLVVIVAAWWSRQRDGHFEDIRQLILKRLGDYYPVDIKVEVHLSIIGAPD